MFIRRVLSALLIAGSIAGSAFAATNPKITVRPQARITQKVDITKLAPLTNTHPANVAKLVDGGRVSSNTMLHGMTMLLKASDAQEYALRSLLDAQQDKSSANYHQWATPDSFGEAFGVESSDLAKVTDWLQSSGFSVDSVTKSKRIVRFSGTAASVEAAFHTEMHQYQVNGETRIANSTDIAIPRALAPIFAALPLNNLRPASNFLSKGTVARGPDGKLHPVGLGLLKATAASTTPDVTEGGGAAHYVGGGDLPILFDSAPLLAAGNDGTGVKIAILGQTDILLGDIQTYRTMFGLKPNNPNFITIGQDPGTEAGDDGESDLDVEASGAMAPGAQIDFYASASDIYELSGILASGLYVIENNSDDIISLSYGAAEVNLGSDNSLLNFLWEQASSQGISVFVSTGDSGPDTYDDNQATAKTAGQQYSVSGFSSTPYNVAVGGTMFDETSGASYWATTNTLPGNVSALGYIPEQPWNEGTLGAFVGIYGGYGGIVSESSGISTYYGTPSWQAGSGVPAVDPTPAKGTVSGFTVPGPHRYQPDVALQAAGGDDGFLTCSEGSCVVDPDGTLEAAGIVGGTSIAAPSMAGVQALINQMNGGRQGLPNYYYYRLAAVQNATTCVSSAMPIVALPGCAFHDIQKGNNFVPTKNGGTVANGNYVGWSAGPGFDLAIGLGSPDINNVATSWSSVNFNATTTAFSITPGTGAFGDPQTYNIAVAPVSGSGTPTGDVSIIAETTAPNSGIGYITLTSGAASGTLPDGNTLTALPAGTYYVHAHYAGDTTYGGSDSPSVQVTVGQGSSTLVVTPYYLSSGGGVTPTSNFSFGQNVYLDGQVCDPSGAANGLCSSGTPTGTLTFTLSQGSTKLPVLIVPLNGADDAYLLSGYGFTGYESSPNYPILPAGTYTVNVAYSGDSTFTASNATPFTITIGAAASTLTATAVSANITSGATATINASVATIAASNAAVTSNGAAVPTGTVTFTDTTTGTTLGSAPLVNGTLVFTTTGLTTTGAHSITAAYGGDANYLASSKTLTITVGTLPAGGAPTLSFTGGVSANTSLVGQTVTVTAAVASPATGTVYFYDSSKLLGNATLSTSTHTAHIAVANFAAGSHNITANYAGSTTLSASSSVVTPLTVGQNTPSLFLQTSAQSSTGSGVAMNVTLSPSPFNGVFNNSTGVYGPISPAPSATVSFLDNGTSVGTAPVTFYSSGGVYLSTFTTKALTPGVHSLTAQYTGDTNYAVGTPSNAQTFSVGLTTIAISAPPTVGTNVAFSLIAQVTPVVASATAMTGTVTFMQGGQPLGTVNVSASGVAILPGALTVTALGPNTVNSITASYSGDSNYYQSSVSGSVTTTAVTPAFTLSLNPTNFTLTQGNYAIVQVTGTVTGNYTGSATLSCSGIPAVGSACTFAPSTLQFSGANGAVGTSTLYIKTTGVHSGGLLWIPAIFFAGFLAFRRKQLSVRGRHIIALSMLACVMLATVGCSGSSQSPAIGITPTGTSTITVTATGTGQAGAPSQTATATFTLTVQ